MTFFKDLLLSILSGLATVFISPSKKSNGVKICKNKDTTLSHVRISGNVDIENNEKLEINLGELNGERKVD